jgi:hypothetical protein
MPQIREYTLAATATTGNNTHTSVAVNEDAESVAMRFIVEAIGGTPTVTWKIQGSLYDSGTSDANSSWFDIPFVTDANETVSTTARTATAVGAQVQWLVAGVGRRFFRKFRLVTTSNTNVTYSALLITNDSE